MSNATDYLEGATGGNALAVMALDASQTISDGDAAPFVAAVELSFTPD